MIIATSYLINELISLMIDVGTFGAQNMFELLKTKRLKLHQFALSNFSLIKNI